MARTPDHLAVLPEVEAEAVGVRHELGLFVFIIYFSISKRIQCILTADKYSILEEN